MVAEVGVADLGVLDDDPAGQRVAVAAGGEVRERVVLDGQPELEVVRAEQTLDHARHRIGSRVPVRRFRQPARSSAEVGGACRPGVEFFAAQAVAIALQREDL